MTGDSSAASLVDSAAEQRFEEDWAAGNPRPIECYLPPSDDPRYLPTLISLVAYEMQLWRKHRRLSPAPPAEDYRARFSALTPPEHLLRVLCAEIQARQEYGVPPERGEYARRFPALFEADPTREDALWEEARAPDPLPRIEGYELLCWVGRGGMGQVYKGRHLALNRVVAIKVLLAGPHADAEELARFKTEAEAAARLEHPGIVHIFAIGVYDGRPYLELEFVEGGSLEQRLRGVPLPPLQAADLVGDIARAAGHAHQRGILHRDLKPGNILLTFDGTPKIADFGLAKRLDRSGGPTRTSAVLGTPAYMAPEQAQSAREITPAADVYSLGAILYETLTGRPPFQADNVLDTLIQVRSNAPVPPSRLNTNVKRDLETICLKCLEKDPARRYASAGELAEDLLRYQRGSPIKARPPGLVERGGKWLRRNWVAAVVMLLLATSSLLAAVFAFNFWRAEGRARDALDRSQDELVKGLLRSFDSGTEKLSGQGVQALQELADLPPDLSEVRQRFVERVVDDPKVRTRVTPYLPQIMHAAVGLDVGRMGRARDALVLRLRDPARDWPSQWVVVQALLALDALDEESAPLAIVVVREGLDRLDSVDSDRFWQVLSATVAQLRGERASELLQSTGSQLADSLGGASGAKQVPNRVGALLVVTERLGEPRASPLLVRAAEAIRGRIEGEEFALDVITLTEALGSITDRLDGAEARPVTRQAVAMILDRLGKDQDPDETAHLALALTPLTNRFAEPEACPMLQQASEVILARLAVQDQPGRLTMLGQAYEVVGKKRVGRHASDLSQPAARKLLAHLGQARDPEAIPGLAAALSTVTDQLADSEARPLLRKAVDVVLKFLDDARSADDTAASSTRALRYIGLVEALTRMTARLAATDADRLLQRAGELILARFDRTDRSDADHLLWELLVVARPLGGASARPLLLNFTDRVVTSLGESDSPRRLGTLPAALRAAAHELGEEQVRPLLLRAANAIADRLEKTEAPDEVSAWAVALVVVVRELGDAHARPILQRCTGKVLDCLSSSDDVGLASELARAYLGRWSRLTAPPSDLVRLKVSENLSACLGRDHDLESMGILAITLNGLAAGMEGTRARSVRGSCVGRIVEVYGVFAARDVSSEFANQLGVVAGELDLSQVARLLTMPLCVGMAREVFIARAEQVEATRFPTRWDLVRRLKATMPGHDFP